MHDADLWRDSLLFTPGPLTTSLSVRQAMLRDLGSRDERFIGVVRSVRARLLALAGVPAEEYEAVLIQGCGSMGVEAVLHTAIPATGTLLVFANGAYGRRIGEMAAIMGLRHVMVRYPESAPIAATEVERNIVDNPGVTHVAVVHCETTSGLFNPIDAIGRVVKRHKCSLIVDAMSSFGAASVSMKEWGIDWLVSSANKCIEGVPGFSFAIIRREALAACGGNSRSLTLDLHAQSVEMRRNGQFRFTPPTHAILAFHQALVEHEREGGVEGRMARYRENNRVLREHMRRLGFEEYLADRHHGWIITSYLYPEHPNFSFDRFYHLLREDGFVIYPGKVGDAQAFRIGSIGRIRPADILALVGSVERALEMMEVRMIPAVSMAGCVA